MPKSSKMDIAEFGKRLIRSKDLDPVYVIVWNSSLQGERLKRWLLAYWCFYHIGTASWIVDQSNYWKAMRIAAGSKDYLRSSERRHFRGNNAINSVTFLQDTGINGLFKPLSGKTLTLTEVMDSVQTWVGFGPWIAFKVADMLERLNLSKLKISQSESRDLFYKSPREGLERAAEIQGRTPEEVLYVLGGKLNALKAPPRYDRYVGALEIETVCCKWNSYMKDHYRIGKDIAECNHALEKYKTETIGDLKRAGRVGGLW